MQGARARVAQRHQHRGRGLHAQQRGHRRRQDLLAFECAVQAGGQAVDQPQAFVALLERTPVLRQLRFGTLALAGVAHRGQQVRLAMQLHHVERHLGVERGAVVAAVQPLEMLGVAIERRADLLQRLVLRGPPVGLELRREAVRRLADDLVAAAAEHLQGGRIAIHELLAAHQEDAVARALEQRVVHAEINGFGQLRGRRGVGSVRLHRECGGAGGFRYALPAAVWAMARLAYPGCTRSMLGIMKEHHNGALRMRPIT